MFIYTPTPLKSSHSSSPRSPYPLRWRPRTYGVSLALAGLGGDQ